MVVDFGRFELATDSEAASQLTVDQQALYECFTVQGSRFSAYLVDGHFEWPASGASPPTTPRRALGDAGRFHSLASSSSLSTPQPSEPSGTLDWHYAACLHRMHRRHVARAARRHPAAGGVWHQCPNPHRPNRQQQAPAAARRSPGAPLHALPQSRTPPPTVDRGQRRTARYEQHSVACL